MAEQLDFELGEVCSNESLEQEIEKLIQAVENSRATLIFVSNEVGMGIVPLGAVSRYFVDNAGRMNQQLAPACSSYVCCGRVAIGS